MNTTIERSESPILFVALTLNGAFSLTCGAAFALFAGPLSRWLGLAETWWLAAVGVVLVGFGARLLWLGRGPSVARAEVVSISAMDLGWVIATVALALGVPGVFSGSGVVATLVVAAIVLSFFDLQAYSLWKTRQRA